MGFTCSVKISCVKIVFILLRELGLMAIWQDDKWDRKVPQCNISENNTRVAASRQKLRVKPRFSASRSWWLITDEAKLTVLR